MRLTTLFLTASILSMFCACTPAEIPATIPSVSEAAPTPGLTSTPQAATATFDSGIPALPDVMQLFPGTPWPTAPASFLVTYSDSVDDTYYCANPTSLVRSLATDVEAIRLLDNGSSLMIMELELRAFEDTEYRLMVNMLHYGSYISIGLNVFITPESATLSVDRKDGIPLNPEEHVITAMTSDGKRLVRIFFLTAADSLSELYLEVVQIVRDGENICDQFQRYLP